MYFPGSAFEILGQFIQIGDQHSSQVHQNTLGKA